MANKDTSKTDGKASELKDDQLDAVCAGNGPRGAKSGGLRGDKTEGLKADGGQDGEPKKTGDKVVATAGGGNGI